MKQLCICSAISRCVVQNAQFLTLVPFFRSVWKETSFVACRGRGGEEEERKGHGGVKERYERVERNEEEEEEEVEEEVMRRRRWVSEQHEEERGRTRQFSGSGQQERRVRRSGDTRLC